MANHLLRCCLALLLFASCSQKQDVALQNNLAHPHGINLPDSTAPYLPHLALSKFRQTGTPKGLIMRAQSSTNVVLFCPKSVRTPCSASSLRVLTTKQMSG